MSRASLLVIDDESLMREYVEEALIREGYRVYTAMSGKDGIEVLRQKHVDLVITDLKMTPMDGLEVLRQVKAEDMDTVVIVMTAYGTIETAISALKGGASDYILKPFTPDTLKLAVDRGLEHRRLMQENAYLRSELNQGYDFDTMVGKSAPMADIYNIIGKVADSRATVLVRGESGTGKELVARAIHYSSKRKNNPFIKVNCAALSAGILESELFGHERGAFTGAHSRKIGRFELADTGTLLLDEVSEINIDLQAKLLRALQEREFERVGSTDTLQVDTRIIATTNRPLEKAVEEGRFREDLFFRLNVITLTLPPLRDRLEDIPDLMEHFLQRSRSENGASVASFAPAVVSLFRKHDWLGNIREMQNAIERAVVLHGHEEQLEPEHFNLQSLNGGVLPEQPAIRPGISVAEIEKQLILSTLDFCKQNRTQAAEMLEISVRTLRNKLNEYRSSGDFTG